MPRIAWSTIPTVRDSLTAAPAEPGILSGMSAPLDTSPRPAELRAWRQRHGLTQRAAAALIGAALRTWEDWEAGRRTMPPAKWALLRRRKRAPRTP